MNTFQQEIYHYIVKQIAERTLKVGDRLPTEVTLAKQFETSRMNAHGAIKTLENQGLVVRNKKQGTFVKAMTSQPMTLELKNLSANRVYVVASKKKAAFIHWNQKTLDDLEDVLKENDRELCVEELPGEPSKKDIRNIVESINETGSSALIFLTAGNESAILLKHVEQVLNYRGDAYLFDRGTDSMDDWPFHLIRLDPFGEGVQAARFLYENGHKHILFPLCGRGGTQKARISYWAANRARGASFEMRFLSDRKIKVRSCKLYDDNFEECLFDEVKRSDKKLTLIIQTDAYAARFLDYAESKGMKAPDDFYLFSFDNNAQCAKYKLTTVAPPLKTIGKTIGQIVCDKHKWLEQGQKLTLRLPSEIIVRQTCGKAIY